MKSAFFILIFLLGNFILFGQVPTGVMSIIIGIIGFLFSLDNECDCDDCQPQEWKHIR